MKIIGKKVKSSRSVDDTKKSLGGFGRFMLFDPLAFKLMYVIGIYSAVFMTAVLTLSTWYYTGFYSIFTIIFLILFVLSSYKLYSYHSNGGFKSVPEMTANEVAFHGKYK